MKSMPKAIGAALAAALIASSGALAGDTRPASVVMVVPAQYAFVRAALDFSALRDVTVISYMTGTNGTTLYSWNAKARQWDNLTPGNYTRGTPVAGTQPRLLVMGTEATATAKLADEGKKWASDTQIMNTFDIVALVNAMNDTLKFSVSEWDWLAKRYSLTLKDVNAERRRYGRYGAPKKTPAAQSPGTDIVMPVTATPPKGEPSKDIEMVAVPPPQKEDTPGVKAPEDK
jgi:hypothetical protein